MYSCVPIPVLLSSSNAILKLFYNKGILKFHCIGIIIWELFLPVHYLHLICKGGDCVDDRPSECTHQEEEGLVQVRTGQKYLFCVQVWKSETFHFPRVFIHITNESVIQKSGNQLSFILLL